MKKTPLDITISPEGLSQRIANREPNARLSDSLAKGCFLKHANIATIVVPIEASTVAADQERALCPCRMAVHGEWVFVPYARDHNYVGPLCY